MNDCVRQSRYGWCLKLLYGMPIACQAPIFLGSGTVLISKSSGIASQRQCPTERPALRFKSTAKFLLQAPGAVYICNGGRRKVDRNGTSAGRIS